MGRTLATPSRPARRGARGAAGGRRRGGRARRRSAPARRRGRGPRRRPPAGPQTAPAAPGHGLARHRRRHRRRSPLGAPPAASWGVGDARRHRSRPRQHPAASFGLGAGQVQHAEEHKDRRRVEHNRFGWLVRCPVLCLSLLLPCLESLVWNVAYSPYYRHIFGFVQSCWLLLFSALPALG